MTTFSETEPVKMLNIGDSGGGKTGALVSLALAGYELFIIDFDRGLDIIAELLRPKPADGGLTREAKLAAAKRIHFQSFTDKLKPVAGRIVPDGMPDAFARALQQATNWKETLRPASQDAPALTFDAGPLTSWGLDRVLVWDSITFAGHAALRYILALNGRMGQHPQIQDWGQAMAMLEDLFALLYSAQVKCNVIMNSHISYVEPESGGVSKGYPMALGNKLPPKVGRYFNTLVLTETVGSGDNAKRVIRTKSKALIELKAPVLDLPAELPVETGLATIFERIRGGKPGVKPNV